MINNNVIQAKEIEKLKDRLKYVTTMKINTERKVLKLRNRERSQAEEFYILKVDIETITEQLEDLKDQLSKATHQINTMEIHNASEKSRLDIRMIDLENHKRGFTEMFEKEKQIVEIKMEAIRNKEDEDFERERLRQLEITEKNELQQREIEYLEQDCEATEKECAILKKRNNAIMLKLRRKLIETEEARRQLMKKHELTENVQ